jgi:hypothetical protein
MLYYIDSNLIYLEVAMSFGCIIFFLYLISSHVVFFIMALETKGHVYVYK